jgi:hypothetical protein
VKKKRGSFSRKREGFSQKKHTFRRKYRQFSPNKTPQVGQEKAKFRGKVHKFLRKNAQVL